MKTADLIGPALDWAVAKCEGRDWPDTTAKFLGEQYYKPSTEWSDGGPIIERERIDIAESNGDWNAYNGEFGYGPTPLVAALRCHVASKLGDEVEIPEELK